MTEFLSPVSRDVFSLAAAGNVERLRQVLSAEPKLGVYRMRRCRQGGLPGDRQPEAFPEILEENQDHNGTGIY